MAQTCDDRIEELEATVMRYRTAVRRSLRRASRCPFCASELWPGSRRTQHHVDGCIALEARKRT